MEFAGLVLNFLVKIKRAMENDTFHSQQIDYKNLYFVQGKGSRVG